MNLSRWILRSMGVLFVYSTAYADRAECIKDFGANASLSNADQIGLSIVNEESMAKAKWALGFLEKCRRSGLTGALMISKNEEVIRKNIATYQDKKDKKDARIASCAEYSKCHADINNDSAIYSWFFQFSSYKRDSHPFNSNVYDSSAASASKYAEGCTCYLEIEDLVGAGEAARVATNEKLEQDRRKQEDEKQAHAQRIKDEKAQAVRQKEAERRRTLLEQEESKKLAELQKQKEVDREKSDKMERSAECQSARALQSYCKAYLYIVTAKEHLDREKTLARRSGYTDARRVRGLTASIMAGEDELLSQSKKYRALTGSAPSASVCAVENKDGYWQMKEEAEESLNARIAKSCIYGK